MIWGYWGQQFPALDQYDTILGFNEPNHVDQSNLDPETAAYAWLELQLAYPGKILALSVPVHLHPLLSNGLKSSFKFAKLSDVELIIWVRI